MRKRFTFYGLVQGIGFRSIARRMANNLGISGWVRNNEEGGVTLVAEGEKEDIEIMLSRLKNLFQENIEKIDETIEKEEGLLDFEVKI